MSEPPKVGGARRKASHLARERGLLGRPSAPPPLLRQVGIQRCSLICNCKCIRRGLLLLGVGRRAVAAGRERARIAKEPVLKGGDPGWHLLSFITFFLPSSRFASSFSFSSFSEAFLKSEIPISPRPSSHSTAAAAAAAGPSPKGPLFQKGGALSPPLVKKGLK